MANVKPVPRSGPIAHLTVRGGAKAIEYYTKVFGAKEISRHLMPDGTIMHAAIEIAGAPLFLNDEYPQMGAVSPLGMGGSPVAIMLYVENVDEVFQRAVDNGAEVKMPLANQFWGDRYGMIADPFGHLWELATHIEDLSPEEMQKRGREAMAQMSK